MITYTVPIVSVVIRSLTSKSCLLDDEHPHKDVDQFFSISSRIQKTNVVTPHSHLAITQGSYKNWVTQDCEGLAGSCNVKLLYNLSVQDHVRP